MAVFSMRNTRLVAAEEAVLPLEIIRGQNQRELFVLMTIAGRRDDIFLRRDVVRQGLAALRRADRRRAVAPQRTPVRAAWRQLVPDDLPSRKHPFELPFIVRNAAFTQKTWLDKSDFSQLRASSPSPCPSNSVPFV